MDLSAYRKIQQDLLTEEKLKQDLEQARKIDARTASTKQSNNTPSVPKQTGNLPKVTQQLGIGFNQPTTPQPLPYANRVSPTLPRVDNTVLQKAQQIGQQAVGKTPAQLRQQNLANINPFNKPAQVNGVGGANAMAGLGQFNSALAKTADFILPDVITPKFVQRGIDYYKNTGEQLAQNAAKVNEEKGVPQWAGGLIQNTVAALPNAALAVMSGGTSLGAQTLGQASTGLAGTITTAMQTIAKTPTFYTSLSQTMGPAYEEAKANGASELEAQAVAIIGGFVNAGIEIGGGIETVAANPRSLLNWVRSMVDEGKEEVLQGIVDNLMQKATYDKDKKWVSLTDENAVINPKRMLNEFGAGAAIGGILGGGQMALGAAVDRVSGITPEASITRREQRALDALSQKTGINIQVDNDIEGSNGYFDRNTNTLHISRNSNNAVYQVAAHEITHSIESNPDEWNQLYEIANANLSAEARANLEDLLKATGYTDAQMQSEVVSHYVQQCVTDIKSFEQLVGVNRTLAQRIVDAFETFVRKLTGQQNIGSWQEAAQIREFIGDITPEQAQQTLAQMKKALAAGGQATGEVDKNVSVPTQDGEVEISSKTGTASASYSLKTWNETDKQKVVDDLVKQNGVTPEQAQKWVDDVNGVARMIASDRMLYNYEASPDYTAVKPNSEYKRTVDMSTNCKKRILLAGTIDEIQRRLPNTALTGEDYIKIREMMKDAGHEVSCGFCYVESRRKDLGKVAEQFVKQLGDPTVTIADITTEQGINYLMQYRPEVYQAFVAFNNKRGSGKVNLVQSRTEYRNEIMRFTAGLVKTLNDMGGLRVQSYSDFETPHLIDMMQVVTDMSRKGLKSQAYTKVPNFADAMGMTGMKINLSLVTSGLDANGNLMFDGVEGMPIEDALRLRELYSENVGTILVGKGDATILAAMADPNIDFIIPYHRSGWAQSEYEALGLVGYKDYTAWQSERLVNPTTKNGKTITRPDSNYYPEEYWDYSKTGKENAEIYLAKCAAEGRIPKFDNFLVNNGDGSWSLQPDGSTDGYWKTLIDFKMYDNNGVGVPQRAVKPEFNPEVLERIMDEYQGDHRQAQVANDIVEKFLASRLSRKLNFEGGRRLVEQRAGALPYTPNVKKPQQLPYAPGYKAAETPVQPTLPRAEELNREQQKNAPMLNNQAVGIVASPELFEAMQSVVDYTTPKPNPEGSRSFDGSVLDNLGQGQTAFNTLDELLAQSKADAARRPADKEGIANVLTERPKKGVKENIEIAADFAARKLIDSGHTIDTIAKAVDDKVLYPLYNNAKQSRQAAEYMIGDAQTDINGNRVGDSLVSIFDPIKSKGEDYFRDFSTYLYHVHNVDRMSLETNGAQVYQDAIMQLEMENPMLQNATREEVEALASGNSDYREAAIEWLQLDDSLNDLHNKPVFGESVTAEDSHKAATELLRKNPEFRELAEKVYAYNRNLMKYRVDAGLVSQKQADIMNALYPHYVPTFRDTSSTTGMKMGGNQAQVARTVRSATGSNLDLMPIDGSMAEQTLQTVRAAKMNIFGARLLEDALKHQDKVGRHIRSVVDKYNSYDMDEPPQYTGGITIYSGGKPVSMDADVGVMEAFKSIQPDPLEGSNIYRRIVEANNTFKALVTGANPMFLAKNFARDLQDAGLYAGDLKDFAKNYPKAWKEIKNNGELWQLYKSQGGTGSSYFDYEKGLVDNKRKGVGKVFDKVEAANMMVEQAPRFSEFMSVLEKEGRTYEGIQKAMLAAADVTVNFGRSGTLTKTLNKTFVPFLNPSIQGADKFIRRFAQTEGAKEWVDLIGRCALLGIAPALLNELLHAGTEEEEEYAMLNDRDKETNYVFRFDDGVWIKVPRGRALSVFGSAAQRTARMLKGEEDAWVGFIELALDQVGTTDPFTGHILSSYLNTELFNPESPGKTWYGGDIEPQRLQGLPPGERYDEKTDELSKWLGKQLNISPKKINHLLDSYTGVIGDIALPLMTPRAERNPFAAAFSIDSTTSNKLQGEFYDKLDELEQNKNSANPDAGTDLAYSYLNGVSREVSELNKQIRAIEANENIKDKDKRERTRKLADERNNLVKNALDVLPQYTEHAASYKGDPDDAKREVNRKQFGAEYALEKYNKEVYENAQKANKYLIPYETFYDVYFAQKDLKSDKDSDGKTIKNSLSKKKKAAIDKAAKSLTQKQKEYLYDMFGVSKSEWNKLPTKT